MHLAIGEATKKVEALDQERIRLKDAIHQVKLKRVTVRKKRKEIEVSIVVIHLFWATGGIIINPHLHHHGLCTYSLNYVVSWQSKASGGRRSTTRKQS